MKNDPPLVPLIISIQKNYMGTYLKFVYDIHRNCDVIIFAFQPIQSKFHE
jgi:hypothetical protein